MSQVKTRRLPVTDAMFLYGETRETMLHVASLMEFTPPADAPPDALRTLVEQLRGKRDLAPPWNLKLRHPDSLRHPLQAWVEDPDVDVDYHVRRSALPAPGDERELGVLVSRLHSNNLDFSRPPWEMHIIEGLEGGRFAFYTKMHHALIDGYTGMKLVARTLSPDPAVRDTPLFVSTTLPARPKAEPEGALDAPGLLRLARDQLGIGKGLGKALFGLARAARADHDDLVLPGSAPKSILNGPIGRNRRFATQQIDIARMKAVGKKAGATLNDVVLALSGGTLRRFLAELNALPDHPLIAMVPVNIRPKDDPGGGNAVAAVLASLATHVADPAERLRAVVASTTRAKQQLQGMSRQAIMAYSSVLLAPVGLQMLKATSGRLRPAFNLVISNVPGPDVPLYFRGARLDAYYPVSIPTHGIALNITCTSYAGTMNFGFIGCRDTLPHLQRLGVYCGEAMAELEKAVA
jgi:WS/DGAT/MGAT family acyltransferase